MLRTDLPQRVGILRAVVVLSSTIDNTYKKPGYPQKFVRLIVTVK